MKALNLLNHGVATAWPRLLKQYNHRPQWARKAHHDQRQNQSRQNINRPITITSRRENWRKHPINSGLGTRAKPADDRISCAILFGCAEKIAAYPIAIAQFVRIMNTSAEQYRKAINKGEHHVSRHKFKI